MSAPTRRRIRAGVLSPADRVRWQGLIRMKAGATALLLVAAVVYVLARRAGGHGWVGYVEAAAEAGMVGGLADWFAVTALFRHPLGLPIPHTAIIPTRKDAARPQPRRLRRRRTSCPSRWSGERLRTPRCRAGSAAGWPSRSTPPGSPPSWPRPCAARSTCCATRTCARCWSRWCCAGWPRCRSGRRSARLLAQVVADKAHHRLVDLVAAAVDDWLAANREQVIDLVARQAPPWSPEFVDRAVAARVYAELARVSAEVRAQPEHAIRQALDRLLARFADDLSNDPATIERASGVLESLLAQPEVRRAFGDVISAGRRLLLEMVDDPDGELRARLSGALADLGRRLDTDDALRARVDAIVADAAGYVVTHYRDELTRTITDTVERWDGVETARKVELAVGRDLQFIRINGTVVGALAGVIIHAVGTLVS